MDRNHLKLAVRQAVDTQRDGLVRLASDIGARPEAGYREHGTARTIAEQFRATGIPFREGLAVTGLKAILAGGGGPGPTVAVIGELDGLFVPDHPQADSSTGAAHACGHNAQLAMLIGVARALQDSGILGHLAGRVALFAVPAEEYVDIEGRLAMREGGKIEFLAGKQELIRLGEFDDVDMAMLVHTTSRPEDGVLGVGGTMNGMVAKFARFVGRAAHAGLMPHRGINALNAAHLALAAIHTQRETFQDEDHVRVHPILTKAGDAVSVVPADVRLETFVRGASLEAIDDAHKKVDRALRAGALAVGATVEITTMPGYLPMLNDPGLQEVFRANAADVVGQVTLLGHRGGSTDMGDLSHIMPCIHPFTGGASGVGHGADYRMADPERAIMNPTRVLATTVVDLLADGASVANRIKAEAKPKMTREEYLGFARGLAGTRAYTDFDPAPA